MFRSRLFPIAACCVVLTACTNVPQLVDAYTYKIDVQQGNVLSQEMVAQLKPGQTRDQVRFLLGTPLITDLFHQQRWDYVYRYQNGATRAVETRKFSVFFDSEDRLERVGGDVAVADVGELTAPVARTRLIDLGELPPETVDTTVEASANASPAKGEPGYFGRLVNWVAAPFTPKRAAAPKEIPVEPVAVAAEVKPQPAKAETPGYFGRFVNWVAAPFTPKRAAAPKETSVEPVASVAEVKPQPAKAETPGYFRRFTNWIIFWK